MKKLLMKWFPKFFNVCQHTYIDLKDVKPGGPFEIKVIEESKELISETLGINEQRFKELMKVAKTAAIETDSITGAMEKASKTCKHANELMMITLLVWDYGKGSSGSMSPHIIELLMNLRGGPPKKD